MTRHWYFHDELETSKTSATMRNLLLPLLPILTTSLQLDIHIPLYDPHLLSQNDLYHLALDSNAALQSIATTPHPHKNATMSERIDFVHYRHLPHITLFLSDFSITLEDQEGREQLQELFQVLQDAILANVPCNTPLLVQTNPHPNLSGPYAMYVLPSFPCLQSLSNTILYAVQPYVNHSQPIPSWIQDLPEPSRSKKIDYIKRYGSPNVLDEFDPHVTVGYDEITPVEERRKVLDNFEEREGVLKWIAVGRAEEMGTVLPGPLYEMELKRKQDWVMGG